MQCDFRQCQRRAYTCGNIICYERDGSTETVCLCKRHIGMLVPKDVREFWNHEEVDNRMDKDWMVQRLRRMADTIEEWYEMYTDNEGGDE